MRHWQHDGSVSNSFSYLFGPIVAFLAIGVLVVVLRWAFNSRKTSVVAAAPTAGSQDEYGVLVPVASPPSYIDGEILRRRLEDAGIKANLANDARRTAGDGLAERRRASAPGPLFRSSSTPPRWNLFLAWPTGSVYDEGSSVARDGGPQGLQVFDQPRVPTIDVIDSKHVRSTLGHQSGEHQTGPRTDVGGFHRCSGQGRSSSNQRMMAVCLHVGSKAR